MMAGTVYKPFESPREREQQQLGLGLHLIYQLGDNNRNPAVSGIYPTGWNNNDDDDVVVCT